MFHVDKVIALHISSLYINSTLTENTLHKAKICMFVQVVPVTKISIAYNLRELNKIKFATN